MLQWKIPAQIQSQMSVLEASVEKESQPDYLGISGALVSTSTLASPILLTDYAAGADSACALSPISLTAAKALLFYPPRPGASPTAVLDGRAEPLLSLPTRLSPRV